MLAWFERAIMRAWMCRGTVACLLYPLSLLTRFVVHKKAQQQPQVSLPVPVIIVGNIFVGGTGKTPLTIYLVDALRQMGFHPGVISRGYGRSATEVLEVSISTAASDVGDEPLLMKQRAQCPVFVGRQRVLAAKALLNNYPDVNVLISDDGLQHYALPRQVEIVLMDQRIHGNGWLLPAGPLREPATRVRDFTVMNVGTVTDSAVMPYQDVVDSNCFVMSLQGNFAEQLINRQHTVSLADFKGKKIAAVAGIGHPERFYTTLKTAGLQFQTYAFPDHHAFSEDDFLQISVDIFLITEKDAVKCQSVEAIKHDPRIWVVPVKAQINHLLVQRIVEKLREFKVT